MAVDLKLVELSFPEGSNIIFGQSHFIKTVEDLYEALVTAVPNIRFGLAFCEASGPRLVRAEGTDEQLRRVAVENAQRVGAGHTFLIVLQDVFPISVMQRVRDCPEVCRIFCATANPVQVVLAETAQGRGVLGVVDGEPPLGVETDEDVDKRHAFLRTIGYKR
jgi:hypothetical protein